MSESTGGFSHSPKNVPKTILELINPIHGIDKMSILNLLAFTYLIYFLILQIGFRIIIDNPVF